MDPQARFGVLRYECWKRTSILYICMAGRLVYKRAQLESSLCESSDLLERVPVEAAAWEITASETGPSNAAIVAH